MKKQLIIIIGVLIITSCKTEVTGYVYSKHGFPAANGTVILSERVNSHDPGTDKSVATTDNNGYFHFKFRAKHSKQYWVRCKSDSGLALGVPVRKTGVILNTY